LRALVEILRGHDAYVIVDEIYAGLTYDGAEHVSLLQVAPELRERIIVVDGVSKRYAMTGYRVGWMLGPRAVARACESVQSQVTTSVCTIAQHAAIAALEGPQDGIAIMRGELSAKRDRMRGHLAKLDGLRVGAAQGAFYLFVDVAGLLGRRDGTRVIDGDVALAEYLLDGARVATVPGSAFGAPGYLRLSYALATADIDRACDRIAVALGRLRAG
jgi:aspartate aminotransferase